MSPSMQFLRLNFCNDAYASYALLVKGSQTVSSSLPVSVGKLAWQESLNPD
jgi:hypothetical protein